MTYTPPVEEQKFLLDHVVDGIGRNLRRGDADLVDAIVEGAGAFAAGEFAPLNRIGDEVGAKWSPEGVTMPPGFTRGLSRPMSRAAGGRWPGPSDSAGRACR